MYPTLFLPYSGLFFDYIESHKKHTMTVQQYHDTYEIYLQTKGERYIFLENICPVSYTHLDVYKRQCQNKPL